MLQNDLSNNLAWRNNLYYSLRSFSVHPLMFELEWRQARTTSKYFIWKECGDNFDGRRIGPKTYISRSN